VEKPARVEESLSLEAGCAGGALAIVVVVVLLPAGAGAEPEPGSCAAPPELPCPVDDELPPLACRWRTTAESGAPAEFAPAVPGATVPRRKTAPIETASASGSSASVGAPTSRRNRRRGTPPRQKLRSLATVSASAAQGC
jgi:hypothetical protein